jgi:predicted nucleic acid-binding protein
MRRQSASSNELVPGWFPRWRSSPRQCTCCGSIAQQDFLTWLGAGGLVLLQPEAEDIQRVKDLMAKYADLPMDFADALWVATCERLNVKQIATLDDDFKIYRFRGRGRFDNVFFEQEAEK